MTSEEEKSPPTRGQKDDWPRDSGDRRTQSTRTGGKKKRVRHWTADDRAAHRVFERSRREAFKEGLTKLASFIPSLENTEPNRLSKHVVLDESTALHQSQQEKLAHAAEQINSLLSERDVLLEELNQWRTGAGISPRPPNPLLPEPAEPPSLDGILSSTDSRYDPSEPSPAVPMHDMPPAANMPLPSLDTVPMAGNVDPIAGPSLAEPVEPHAGDWMQGFGMNAPADLDNLDPTTFASMAMPNLDPSAQLYRELMDTRGSQSSGNVHYYDQNPMRMMDSTFTDDPLRGS